MAATSERPKLSEIIRLLEQRPFDLTMWQTLEKILQEQNDPFSLKTLAVIIRGIKALGGRTPDSRTVRDTFARLAKSYNNPIVIRAAAKHYLMELNLPGTAKEHLAHCKTLGVNDSETAQLLNQAETELRRRDAQLVTVSTSRAAMSIRKTGKISLLPQVADASRPDAVATLPLEKVKMEQPSVHAAACLVSGDLVSARLYLKRGVVDSDPQRYWELWTELGNAHYEKNQFLDARSAYNEACTIAPENVISQFNLGTGKLVTGDFNGALKCFQKADDIESFEPKVLCNVGAAYFLQDEYIKAESILRETIRIKPDYIRALNTLSSVLGAMNRLDESLEICNQILEMRPGHPEASMKKGIICLNDGQLDEAIDCLTDAVTTPELQVDAHCYLAQALAAQLQTNYAEETLQSAFQLGTVEPELACNSWKAIGRGWRKENDTNRSVAAFQRVCQLDPRDAEAWYELGITYGRAKHDSYARECFQTYFRLSPEAAKRTTVEKLLEGSR